MAAAAMYSCVPKISVTRVAPMSASTSEILLCPTGASGPFASIKRPPSATVPRQKLVSRSRAASARDIIGKIARRIACPGVKDRLHRSPATLDIIGALKQRRIANHAIVDEGLVSGIGLHLEVVLVGKVHADGVQFHG